MSEKKVAVITGAAQGIGLAGVKKNPQGRMSRRRDGHQKKGTRQRSRKAPR